MAGATEGPGSLDAEQEAAIERYEAAAAVQLAAKPRRLAHSLSVGREAERLARIYGVDPYEARVAGILHDWEKATPDAELVEVARDLGIAMEEELDIAAPLLHGLVARRTLPERFPELGPSVLQAIERHTLGAQDMTPLDMVLFVADGIEPTRGANEALDAQRALVGEVPLFELWWRAFRDGIDYVVDTQRHLYTGTVAIYNAVCASLARE